MKIVDFAISGLQNGVVVRTSTNQHLLSLCANI